MATPGALSALNPDDLLTIVERHASGDWGERCQEDVAANEAALHDGSRLLSAYTVNGERLWVITDGLPAQS